MQPAVPAAAAAGHRGVAVSRERPATRRSPARPRGGPPGPDAPRGRLRRAAVGRLLHGALSAALLLAAAAAPASSVRSVSVEELLRTSALIFEGTVEGLESRAHADGQRVHTFVRFRVEDVLKGPHPGPSVTLRFLGGRAGPLALKVTDLEPPAVGDHGLWFVESLERPQVHPLTGWDQGCLLTRRDARGRRRVVTRAGAPVLGLGAGALRAPTGDVRPPRHARGVMARPGAPLDAALELDALKGWLRERVRGAAAGAP